VGAVVLGGAMALLLRGPRAEAPPAPTASEAAPAAAVVPAPAAVEAPKPAAETVEIGLDPAGPKAEAKEAKPAAAPAASPAPAERRAPRPERERPTEDTEAPATDGLARLRAQAQAYAEQGKTAEALAAYQQALAAAKRSRDRQQIARRMYDLTHPGD
jgi:hypothetical protein